MNLDEFTKNLGLKFKNTELLKNSLVHRSLLNEKKDKSLKHNERLEFLGDAVLELIISEYLYQKYPERPEGELTSFRAAVVNTVSLGEISKELGIGQHLLLSKGEEMTGGREKEYLLANAFEALLGAIYLDQGYDDAREFVKKYLVPKLNHIVKYRLDVDPKTQLQEEAQSILKVTPTYRVIDEKGPDHDKIFTVVVKMNGKVFGKGKGPNKQKAEENAAKEAIAKLQNLS